MLQLDVNVDVRQLRNMKIDPAGISVDGQFFEM